MLVSVHFGIFNMRENSMNNYTQMDFSSNEIIQIALIMSAGLKLWQPEQRELRDVPLVAVCIQSDILAAC